MKTVIALAIAPLLAVLAVAHAAPPEVLPAKAASSAVKVEKNEEKKEEKALVKAEKKSAKAAIQGGKGPISPNQ